MNIQLVKFLEIQINHEYFSKGICDVLNLLPTANTGLLMNNYSLKMRAFSNQISFYYSINSDLSSTLQEELKGLGTLSFKILCSDINFINYTDLTYPSSEDVGYFFSNQVNTSDASALQKGQYVSSQDQLQVRPFVFSISLPSEINNISIKNNEGVEVIQQQLDGISIKSFTVNLEPFGEGRYTLWINGEKQTSYFVSGETISENCLGILQLSVAEIISRNTNSKNQILYLRFNARSTYWKYSVVLAPDRQITIKEMSIESSGNISYSGPETDTIVGGSKASVFTSSSPIPLHQENAFSQLLKIRFNNNFSDRLNEMDIKIPNPDISKLLIKKNDSDTVSFYSSKIIYI